MDNGKTNKIAMASRLYLEQPIHSILWQHLENYVMDNWSYLGIKTRVVDTGPDTQYFVVDSTSLATDGASCEFAIYPDMFPSDMRRNKDLPPGYQCNLKYTYDMEDDVSREEWTCHLQYLGDFQTYSQITHAIDAIFKENPEAFYGALQPDQLIKIGQNMENWKVLDNGPKLSRH